jgi:hypothetical protein
VDGSEGQCGEETGRQSGQQQNLQEGLEPIHPSGDVTIRQRFRFHRRKARVRFLQVENRTADLFSHMLRRHHYHIDTSFLSALFSQRSQKRGQRSLRSRLRGILRHRIPFKPNSGVFRREVLQFPRSGQTSADWLNRSGERSIQRRGRDHNSRPRKA